MHDKTSAQSGARADGPVITLVHRLLGQGPPLLLLAGTGYSGATWSPVLTDLLAKRYTVIAVDYRGTGDTPGTEDDYSTRLFAADALALLQELDRGPAHVLGHSMGGRVAQWLALDGSELVRSLVLAASGPGPYAPDRPCVGGVPLNVCLALVELGYEGYIRHQIARTFFTPEFVAHQPETVDWLVRAFWEHRPDLRNYLKHVVARQQHDTVDRLGDIRTPTLVLVGDRDTHVGGTGSHVAQSEYLAAHLPFAELQRVEGAAHGYFWQCPEEVAPRIIDFLARRD